MTRHFLAMAFSFIACIGSAQGQTWHDEQGKAVPESSSRKSVAGFSGMILLTPDKDWQQKWDTPPETMPHFREIDTVRMNGEIAILIFFSNPQLDSAGLADVTCDLDMIRPDGSVSLHESDIECYKGAVKGELKSVFLSKPSLLFVAEQGDLPGKWTVKVTLRDKHRAVELALETGFDLIAE